MLSVIMFIFGLLIGVAVIFVIKRPKPVGTLQITYADESSPYMFLELEKDVSYVRTKKYVTMRIHEKNMVLYEEQ